MTLTHTHTLEAIKKEYKFNQPFAFGFAQVEKKSHAVRDNDFICCFNNNINTLLLNVGPVYSFYI